jgi:hypothetical protein
MEPYNESHLNQIYQQLFCDDIDAYGSDGQQTIDPWKSLLDREISDDALQGIKSDESLETRPRLLANNLLRLRAIPDESRHLYGVIVEVHMEEGLDVLAVYEDGSARYINYSGRLIIWDAVTDESHRLKEELFIAAEAVVKQIGPWEDERLPPPVTGNARLSFLVADGIYFGEAPFDALAGDPMGGNALNKAAAFMTYLVENSMDQSR